MNVVAFRRFEALGRWLFAAYFANLTGIAVCWAGLSTFDRADWALATIGLVVGSLYLAIASFVAAAVFHSCGSTLAFRFFNVAAVAALFGLAGPIVAALVGRS